MKLMIVRHAEPDYSIDSLTPAGWEEAKILADRLCKLDIIQYRMCCGQDSGNLSHNQ